MGSSVLRKLRDELAERYRKLVSGGESLRESDNVALAHMAIAAELAEVLEDIEANLAKIATHLDNIEIAARNG